MQAAYKFEYGIISYYSNACAALRNLLRSAKKIKHTEAIKADLSKFSERERGLIEYQTYGESTDHIIPQERLSFYMEMTNSIEPLLRP